MSQLTLEMLLSDIATMTKHNRPTPERTMRKKYRNQRVRSAEERRTRAKYRIPIARKD